MEKKRYEQPEVNRLRVVMEESVADVRISVEVYLEPEWEEGGMIGIDTPTEGGDIYFY